jgi:effector-binding domain-containing protein
MTPSKSLFIGLLALSILFFTVISHAGKTEDAILKVTEGFFIALKEKRFTDAWEFLTIKSRDTIIDEVYRDINKTKAKIGKEVVREEFDKKRDLFLIYWNAFIKDFDPNTVLEQSVWNIGEIKGNKATIILQYKRSEYPAELKIYKENGKWQFGLVESFCTRK